MSLRFLFGILTSVLQDQNNHSETVQVPEKEGWAWNSEIQLAETYGPAQLHVGMLTISLLVGLAYGGFVGYTCWMEKDVFLGYIRNLVIALVCRTLFTITFDGVVLLGSRLNVAGGNALSALEQICINLVLGLWLSLTVYAHARVQRNFKSEPTLRLYRYGIPAVAAFFAFVWIFTMQNAYPNSLWWEELNPFSQWIVHSANLLFLLIQLVLVGDMWRMMMPVKSSLDNDSVSVLWKVAAMMAALVFIFWLQFGLSLGNYKIQQSYLYFFYFVDGVECTLVCVFFYLFYRWVTLLRNKWHLCGGTEEREITTEDERKEEVLPGGRGIVTVDSICVTTESGRWRTSEEDSSEDVVYSNVVEPHCLQKTLELYKRFNAIPNQVSVVDGEQFYDCLVPLEPGTDQKSSPTSLRNHKMIEPTQKKNAFYSSKYLILDSKEGEIPKYLETRPSVSSVPENPKEQQRGKTDAFSNFELGGELVKKWLNNDSENLPRDRSTRSMIENLCEEDSDLKKSEPSEENLIVEKLDNNRLEFGEQSIPEIVSESHSDTQIGLELSTENDAGAPRTETPAATNNTEDTHSEGGSSQSLNTSVQITNKSDTYAPAPTKTNEPEATDKPTESAKPFLTYSELLEFRSKLEKSDEPSGTEGTLSKVFKAGNYFLKYLAGFAQADDNDDFTKEKFPRQAQVKYEEELHTGEKLKELRPEEPKPHSDLSFSSSPEKQAAEQPEDAGIRPESIKKGELTLENEIKNHIEFPAMQNFEEQCFIIDREKLPQELKKEEEESSVESSLGSDLARPSFDLSQEKESQKPVEYRKDPVALSSSSQLIKHSSDLNKAQIPRELSEYREESLVESSGLQVVRQSLDVNKYQPPQKLTEEEEELLETSSASEFSVDQRQSISSLLRGTTNEKEKLFERFSDSETDSNQNSMPQKPIQYEEELLETSSASEFSIEKRQSISPVLRRKTNGKEKSLERFSGWESETDSNQNPLSQKLIKRKEELFETSSDSEFSIENRHSFTYKQLSKPIQKNQFLRTAGPATSQATAATNSEVTLERKPSSSSCESFSLEQYYTKLLRDRAQIRN